MDQKFVSFVVPTVASPLNTRAWDERNLPSVLATYKQEPKEGYYSMFSPAADEIAIPEPGLGDFKGFRGKHKLTMDLLALDFDSKDDTNLALADVRAFIRDMHLHPKDFALFESGSKGYHLYVHASLFGNLLSPHTTLNEQVKRFAQALKVKYKTLDSGIYDIQRKFRIPFSIHPKTGKPKKLIEGSWPLPESPQHDGLSQLFMSAQVEHYANATTAQTPEVVFDKNEDGPVFATMRTVKVKPCISFMLDQKYPSGDRHRPWQLIVNDLAAAGNSRTEILTLTKVFRENNNQKDRDRELDEHLKDIAKGKTYLYGCADPLRAVGCKSSCPVFPLLSAETVASRPAPADQKTAQKQQDKGAAVIIKRFAQRLIQEHSVVHVSETDQFYVYDGEKHRQVKEIYFGAQFERAMSNLSTNKNNAELIGTLRRSVSIPMEMFKASTLGYINFKNGHFNKLTGQLEERLASRFFTYCLPFNYEPNAKAPRFTRFLGEVTSAKDRPAGDPDLAQLLLEYLGYTLSGDLPWAQKSVMLLGEGRNGKSALLDLVTYMVGKGNFSSLPLDMLAQPERRAGLEDKLANIINEENPQSFVKFATAFKAIVSGEAMTARYLTKQPYEMIVTAKMWASTNNAPQTSDTSEGFFRRFLLVPFDAVMLTKDEIDDLKGAPLPPGTFPADHGIFESLRAEAPGVFNMAWVSYQAAKKRGAFTKVDLIEKAKQEFREEASTTQFIIREAFSTVPGSRLSYGVVMAHFAAESERLGSRYMPSIRALVKDIQRVFPDQIEKLKSNGEYYLVGLDLKKNPAHLPI